MKVRYSTQVFSQTVSAIMSFLVCELLFLVYVLQLMIL